MGGAKNGRPTVGFSVIAGLPNELIKCAAVRALSIETFALQSQ